MLVTNDLWLGAYLASRCAWFCISQTSVALGERAGMNRYRLFGQYIREIPAPTVSNEIKIALNAIAAEVSDIDASRSLLHRSSRRRIATDFGSPITKLNTKLESWRTLDFPQFRTEVRRALKREIAVRERDEWAAWLEEQQVEHRRLTEEIVRLETELNEQVYALFDLSPSEIAIIEESTKYPYGEA